MSPTSSGKPNVASVTVVVPARNEAHRIAPLLDALREAEHVVDIIVVDDHSTDNTATVATAAGARVVAVPEPPPGWAGKTFALHHGLLAARTDWVVCLDADAVCTPSLPHTLATLANQSGHVLLSAATRFDTSPTVTWLHAAMLTTLIYRFGSPAGSGRVNPDRLLSNGQCWAVHRPTLSDFGGIASVANYMVEDVALARHIARHGGNVGFVNLASQLTVRPYRSVADVWNGWGRSIALPGVASKQSQLIDLVTVAVASLAPPYRLITKRADWVDIIAIACRAVVLIGAKSTYRNTATYWLSPLADPIAVAALARSTLARTQRWASRVYVNGRAVGHG